MSIIIHGMDVPKNAEQWIRVQPDGKIVSRTGYVIEDASAEQIPPHGDLIDRDELKGIIGKFPLSWEYGDGVTDCWNALIEAPTIIEAEEG